MWDGIITHIVLTLIAYYFPDFSFYSICVIGVTAQAFIGQASKAATEGQEALKGLNQKEQAAILQVWHDLMD